MMRNSEYEIDYFLVVSNITWRKWALKEQSEKEQRGKQCYSELDLALFPFFCFYLTALVPFYFFSGL